LESDQSAVIPNENYYSKQYTSDIYKKSFLYIFIFCKKCRGSNPSPLIPKPVDFLSGVEGMLILFIAH
jgi:hypothetical protein